MPIPGLDTKVSDTVISTTIGSNTLNSINPKNLRRANLSKLRYLSSISSFFKSPTQKLILLIGEAIIIELSEFIDENDILDICQRLNPEIILRRAVRQVRKHSLYKYFGFDRNFTLIEIPHFEREVIKHEITFLLRDDEFKYACNRRDKELIKEVTIDFVRKFISEYVNNKRSYMKRSRDGAVFCSNCPGRELPKNWWLPQPTQINKLKNNIHTSTSQLYELKEALSSAKRVYNNLKPSFIRNKTIRQRKNKKNYTRRHQ